MILTRYAMRRFKIRKELFDVAAFLLPGFLDTLSDTLVSVGTGRDIKQALVGLGVLHNRSRFTLNRQDNGALAPLELFHKITRAAAEGCQRVNVFSDVEHRNPSSQI